MPVENFTAEPAMFKRAWLPIGISTMVKTNLPFPFHESSNRFLMHKRWHAIRRIIEGEM